jgi:Zn-dependent protease
MRLTLARKVRTPKCSAMTQAAPAAEAAPPKPPNNLVGLGLLGLFVALGAVLSLGLPGERLATFGFVLTGWVLAVMAHEFAHAFVAYKAGDWTVKVKGYLAFDPRRYGDLGTSLVIPLLALALGGIGFPGGAVYLRNDLMRSPAWRAAASLAGPGATLLVLLVLALVLNLWSRAALPDALFMALAMLAFLQATALLLNLLPVPGLDGFNAIRPFLPRRLARAATKYEGLAMLGLLAALILLPGVGGLLFGAAADIAVSLGVPGPAILRGWDAFHFWK